MVQEVILSWNLVINLGLIFTILITTLLIVKWLVSFTIWKWQDIIDERAREQQKLHYQGPDDDEEKEERDEPPTHYTAKTTRRRK